MLRPVCVQIHTYNFQTSVCVCVCLFACMRAGLGNRWRLGASSADTGVENPAMELRLQGKWAADDWGPGWRTDVMEPASSWTSLSPAVCGSDCLSVAPTVKPPAYLGCLSVRLSVCMLTAIVALNLSKAFLCHRLAPFLSLLNQSGYRLVVCPLLFFILSLRVCPSVSLPPSVCLLEVRAPSFPNKARAKKTIKPNCTAKHFLVILNNKRVRGLFSISKFARWLKRLCTLYIRLNKQTG